MSKPIHQRGFRYYAAKGIDSKLWDLPKKTPRKALTVPTKLFKGRHFNHDITLLCIRWYVTYKLSYRDLLEMNGGTWDRTGAYDDPMLHSSVRKAIEEHSSLCRQLLVL